jgi:hypothetical protein
VSANVLVKDHACESTYKLAASIALHSVSLAVTSEVVGTAALVASSGTRVTTIPTAESTVESPARSTGTTTGTRSRSGAVALEHHLNQPNSKGRRERVWSTATYSEMAGLVAVVAAAVSSTVETQSRTIGLNVA